MESLVNEEVKHLKFGRGSIVEEPAEHIKVRFQSGGVVKTFRFPDAFAGYLAFEKGELQEKYNEMAMSAGKRDVGKNSSSWRRSAGRRRRNCKNTAGALPGRRKPQQGPPLRIQNRNFCAGDGSADGGSSGLPQNLRRDGYGRC